MKQEIATEAAPVAIGPYSQGIVTDGFIFSSGQLPIDSSTKKMADSIEKQAICSLENVKAVLEAGGSKMSKVVKTTIYLSDMDDFATVNKVYETYFDAPFPARSCFQVAKLPLGAKIEIEAIAVLN